MLCKNFELIPIKIGFFINFLRIFEVAQKSGQRHCTIYSTGALVKFRQK